MSFASPLALIALVAVPLAAAAHAVFQRRRPRFAERFASLAMLPNVIDRDPGWRRHVPAAILLLALATMLVGAARPRAMVAAKRENATVVLVVDASRSMAATDVTPSRLAAAPRRAAPRRTRAQSTYPAPRPRGAARARAANRRCRTAWSTTPSKPRSIRSNTRSKVSRR